MRSLPRSLVLALAAATALGGALTGCQSDGGAAPPPVSRESGAPPEPSVPDARPPVGEGGAPPRRSGSRTAGDGSDLSACYDGSCEVAVSAPAEIPVDGALGMERVTVEEIEGGSVTLSAGPGRIRTSGRGTLNGLSFTVLSVEGGTAVLAFSPAG